jgi:hypothetical protein
VLEIKRDVETDGTDKGNESERKEATEREKSKKQRTKEKIK